MRIRVALCWVVLAFGSMAIASDQAIEQMGSYPVEVGAEKVVEFPKLSLKFRDLEIKSDAISVVPIHCERGVTGAMLIGNGIFRYRPEKGTSIEGHFRAGMFRFNPADQPSVVPLAQGKTVNDRGIGEMARHLMKSIFRHCWHRGDQALIPPKGTLSVVLYSKEHGDLLISDDGKERTVYSFTEKTALYQAH
jgi:hypothetical protein